MYSPSFFHEHDPEKIRGFLEEYPFATLLSASEPLPVVSHLPFLLEEREGKIFLYSHMAKANPHWKRFADEPKVMVLFQGPHAYISPIWYPPSPTNVPTWNYTAVHIHGLATVLEDPAVRWSVMDRLVSSAEAKYGQGWTAQADALGSQFDQIVVFQIDVQKTEAKFKLSQQQNPGVRQNVAEQLQRSPFANSRAVGDLMAGRKANQVKEGNLLEWARRLQALAQNGLAFTKDPFDKDRYETIRNLAAEMIASDTGIEVEVIRDIFLQDAGYATPKIDVRGAVFRDDTLLLVRERSDGKWTVPGGYADIGDSPSEAAVKEVREESGYLTRATKILMAYDKRKQDHPAELRHIYKLFYLCELLGGEPKPDQEISEVGFFGENEIPELSLARVTPNQIKRLFHHHRTPNLPTDFD